MLFSSWDAIWRTALVGVLAYFSLIVLLRISGKRTLSKMNAFDLVVTVAIGSTLATILLNRNVALAEGVTAFAVLILAQFAITWLSVRSRAVQNLVKSEPTLLARDGEFLRRTMRRERITEEEILAAARDSGFGSLARLEAVILETDGSISVLPKRD